MKYTLKKNSAYMLRRDGQLYLLEDDADFMHPYIIYYDYDDNPSDIIRNTLDDGMTSIDWFYQNTLSEKVKNLIRSILKSAVIVYAEDGDLPPSAFLEDDGAQRETFSYFGIDDKTYAMSSKSQIAEAILDLNKMVNQEFLRIRTSDMYVSDMSGSGDGSIYFRVSSTGFNWFDLIWQVAYDNRRSFKTLTIVNDENTDDVYRINGEKMWQYPIQDFITMSGTPVIETIDISGRRKQYGRIS